MVYFPEGAGGDRFEEKVFQGPIDRITRGAISFIERNYIKETVIKHPDRPEAERLWNFPLAAIEEAVVNAVCHRSYEIREPVEVRVSLEDLVVLSYPGPDRSIYRESRHQVTPGFRLLKALSGEMSRQSLQAALSLKDDEHFTYCNAIRLNSTLEYKSPMDYEKELLMKVD